MGRLVNQLQGLPASTPVPMSEGGRLSRQLAAEVPPAPSQPKAPLGSRIGGFINKYVIPSEKGFGESIAGAITPFLPSYKKAALGDVERGQQADVLRKKVVEQRATGQDATQITQAARTSLNAPKAFTPETIVPAYNKSTKQIIGEAVGTAADIASFGTYGAAARGAQTGKLFVTGSASGALGKVLPSSISPALSVQQELAKQLAAQGFREAAEAVTKAKVGALTSAQAIEKTLLEAVGKNAPKSVLSQVSQFTVKNKPYLEAGLLGVDTFAKSKLGAMGQGFLRGATKSAPIGAGFGASEALKNDEDLGGILSKTFSSAVTGGILGGTLEGIASRKQVDPKVLKQQAIEQYKKALSVTKEKYKEKADKIIPQLLEEKWMGTRKQLLEKAEKGMQLSNEEYEKLGELKGIVDTDGLIEMINREVEKLGTRHVDVETGQQLFRAFKVNKTKVNTLLELKADIESIRAFDDLGRNATSKQRLRELAQQYGKAIYDTRKAQKTVEDSQILSEVKKVDSAIRELLNTEEPTYAQINKVFHLNSELASILNETKQRTSGHKLFGLQHVLETMGTLTAAATGGAVGGGQGVVTGILGGLATTGIIEIANSTWWNTWRAVNKAQLADKLMKVGLQDRTRIIRAIALQGEKAALQFIHANALGSTDSQ